MTDVPALLNDLTGAFNQRAWSRAKELAAKLLATGARHASVHYIAGIACMELQQWPPALEHLQRAATLEPERADFAVHLAKALSLARRTGEAKTAADRARPLCAGNAAMLDTLGVIYTHAGEHESAASAFREAAKVGPQHAPFRYNLATALIAAGRIDEAEAELEACLALNEHHWLAHLTLAQLRRQTAAHNHVPRLERLLKQASGQAPDSEALMCLNMALAKEREDLADYAQAFQHLVRGKSVGATRRQYSSDRDEALFAAITDAFQTPRPAVPACGSAEPIFVIGMPRSGTTLVERILSSHPEVQSAGELLNFGVVLKQMSRCQTRALIDVPTIHAAAQPDWRRLGESYVTSTRPATGSKPRFIDKLPHNFLYAGYIATALPNAKIVCLRREPTDTCLSNFRQLFAPNSPFFDYSFDLLDTGRYFVLFDRLMAHWQNVLPGRILELDYETIVDAQEASTRKLLQHCGLAWHDACLQFERNPGPVATASAVQVRAPLNRNSLQRWRHYAEQVAGLRELLRRSGIALAD